MSLEFFAVRFGLSAEELSYGMMHIGELHSAVIIAKEKNIIIDVCQDIMMPTELPGVDLNIEEVTFEETTDSYVFKAEKLKVSILKEEMERFYANRYYSEATETYISRP